ELMNKIKEVGDKRAQQGDKQTASQLQEAAAEAAKNQIDKAMKDAKAGLNQKDPVKGEPMPQHGQALKDQQKAIDGLEKMLTAMGDRRDEDVQKLLQKQMDAEAKIAELLKKQEELQKKTQEKLKEQDLLAKKKKKVEDELAKKKRDQKDAKAELEKIDQALKQNQADLNKLAQQQRELQKLVQEKARELRGMQADQAGKALSKAAQEMERAAQMLEKGENPDEPQQEARDRLEDAQDQLQDAQDELLREQLAKIADKLKGLKERQDGAVKEMARLHAESVEKHQRWTAGQLRSLGDLGETQKSIAREADSLKEKLKGAKVFERILERAAKNMEDAAEVIGQRREKNRRQKLDDAEMADELAAQQLTLKHQTDAAKRLQRLLDALKDEQLAKRPQQKKDDKKNGGGKEEDNKLGGPGDGIPDIAQLKALPAEQQELNDRPRAFVERQMAILVAGGGAVPPAPVAADAAPMTPAQRTELNQLEAEQAGLRELFELITRPPQRDEKEQP